MLAIPASIVCLLLMGLSTTHGTSIAAIMRTLGNGVVIGKRYLLFTPSDVADGFKYSPPQVQVGSNQHHFGGKYVDIKGFVPHPNYTPGTGQGRTGKDNQDNIAVVILAQDLPIGRENIEQANLPGNPNFNTVGSAHVLSFGYNPGQNYTKSNITIHSEADCQKTHRGIDCTRNLWATAIDNCDLSAGSPVFSGKTLIGTIANSGWCAKNDEKHLFINSLPHYEKWIR